uniref:Uncharacterized protein n=1 Tax=Picea glauca TaxID=3330 RepID=A0A124GMQ4_PICGL|nr:hypothetical protein ABT39_MTgene1502 [Picea glauca]
MLFQFLSPSIFSRRKKSRSLNGRVQIKRLTPITIEPKTKGGGTQYSATVDGDGAETG